VRGGCPASLSVSFPRKSQIPASGAKSFFSHRGCRQSQPVFFWVGSVAAPAALVAGPFLWPARLVEKFAGFAIANASAGCKSPRINKIFFFFFFFQRPRQADPKGRTSSTQLYTTHKKTIRFFRATMESSLSQPGVYAGNSRMKRHSWRFLFLCLLPVCHSVGF